ERGYRARRKCRRERSALMFPGAAFRNQQALAEYRAQHPHPGGRSGIVLVIFDQHMPNGVRRIENKAGTAKEAPSDNVLFMRSLTPGADRALTHRRHAS